MRKHREKNKGKYAVIYARVATIQQDGNSNNLNLQIQHCKEFCKRTGLKVRRIFVDAPSVDLIEEIGAIKKPFGKITSTKLHELLINRASRLKV